MSMRATVEATPNIAVVKYWGKRDETLILPTHSSLSFTMDETLCTRTTVVFSPKFRQDELWLNGQQMDLQDKETAERFGMLELIRKQAGIRHKAKIASLNGFPTAAGFASSAAGMAALACAASKAAGLDLNAKDLSILARLGSGSACRSVMGGCVEWKAGKKADGSDSYAEQVAPASHWPELRNVIAVVDAKKKKVSSRSGMKQTIRTSALYPARVSYIPVLMRDIKAAIQSKDFPAFGELTMREAMNMHAVMLDTWPPIVYLNDYSKEIMYAVNEYNQAAGKIKAAYTFDAGPNAHVYTTDDQAANVRKMLQSIDGVKKIITCKVGNGPQYLKNGHLLEEDGTAIAHQYVEGKGIVKT
ncbi:diphosphomevalonate decarboxylase [Candidatus Micrarchaeota archaeon]|nr:diphosphomevalonate decarboxylase [Candidatus Micrarchaeota archaeon]